jgi:hypothetical protein
LVDISLDLAPVYVSPSYQLQFFMLRAGAAKTSAAAAAAAAAALPGMSSALLRAWRLASWLAKYQSSVRSLCIPSGANWDWLGPGPAWGEHLRSIRDALAEGTAQGVTSSSSSPLHHLVQLELPICGLAGNSAFLEALSACPSLQRLVPKEAGGAIYEEEPSDDPADGGFKQFASWARRWDHNIDVACLTRALAPLTCLRVLHVEWAKLKVSGSSLAALLRALPPTLEDMNLVDADCEDSIPLSCFTHLVNLRALDSPRMHMVIDDSNSSSSSSSSSGSGGGSSSSGSGAAGLTALSQLTIPETVDQQDARLQLPNLRNLETEYVIDPAVWQQLQGMKHLQQLATGSFSAERRRHPSDTQGNAGVVGLAGMTQLQHMELDPHSFWEPYKLSVSEPWADAVAKLTQLTALRVGAHVLVAGASTMLAALTQLQTLTVDCAADALPSEYYPDGAEGWAATPVGAAVQAVAAAMQSGRSQLQRLVLEVPSCTPPWQDGAQQVQSVANASLPGLVVQVQGPRCLGGVLY